MELKRGHKVTILAGKDRGKTGTIERVIRKNDTLVVGGINIMKKHAKPSKKYPSGGIIEIAYPIHQSNVKVTDADGTSTKAQASLKGQAKPQVRKPDNSLSKE